MSHRRFSVVTLLSPLVVCVAGLWVASSPVLGKKSFPNDSIQLETKVSGQKYCASEVGGLPKLTFTLSLQFRNLLGTPLMMDHVGIDDAVYIGKTIRDLHTRRYEPGSRLPDTVGISHSMGWKADGRKVGPRGTFEVSSSDIWVLVATDSKQNQMGVSSGRHFLQIFAEVEISDESHGPSTMILSSLPAPFVVDTDPKIESCH